MRGTLEQRHRANVIESFITTCLTVVLAFRVGGALWAWLLVGGSAATSLAALTALRPEFDRLRAVLAGVMAMCLIAAIIVFELSQ
jgi:hypothetical protein